MNRVTLNRIYIERRPDPEPYDEFPRIGIVAVAEFTVDIGVPGAPFKLVQRVESPGCWGIETNPSDPDDLAHENGICEEEIATLKSILDAMSGEDFRRTA